LPRGIFNSIATEIPAHSGYVAGGEALTGEVWTVDATSAMKYKFDTDDLVTTAIGTALTCIKYAAIYVSAAASANRHLLCYVTLTSTAFTLAKNNTLTIQQAAGGVLTLK
jgi:hypothetical protein